MMGAAQFAGAWIGVRPRCRIGTKLVRPALVILCSAPALRLATRPGNPWGTWIGGLF